MTRLDALLQSGSAVAVVGMAGRFPGASDVGEFWHNIRNGIESVRPLSDEELTAAGVPQGALEDPTYVKAAAPLDAMDYFDAGFFGFNPREAAIMDPQHRQFLECSWEALEDAGYAPGVFGGAIGVFAGCGTNSYFWANVMTNPDLVREVGYFLLRHTGNDKDFLSTRVSYELNLTGPSINVQTACSTSLVALHYACESLLAGECDMALTGAVTIEQPHGVGYFFRENEILSPDGHCRAFDARAAGTVFGSGVGIVVVRRLEDAIEDGDQIRAVILSSAINNDGSNKVGYLAPSVDGQAKAIAEALTVSDVTPDSIQYVEAHGTGTAVGDPIEVAALTEAFRTGTDASGFCGIGSVKTNIGHLDTAAGVAELIKAICALERRELPPSLNYEAPNAEIDFDKSPFFVNAELRAWESDGPRRAGMSALGIGGTNAFVVVEEAPKLPQSSDGRSLQVLPMSGRSPRVLEAVSGDLGRYLEGATGTPPPLADVAYTLSVGRRAFQHRRVVVVVNGEEAVDALVVGDEDRVVSGEALASPPPVSFLFAGGGAQYAGMGAGLYEEEPVYREVVDECLSFLPPELTTSVRQLLLDPTPFPGGPAEMERPGWALPALFITQFAQSRLWMSWGIRPESMIGHSMGEYTAACLAGVLSLEDALSLVVVRGQLFEEVAEGGMLSVNLSEEALRDLLSSELSVAAVNAPELTVASGPVAAIQELQKRLADQGVECRRIHISVAAHSAMLETILPKFEEEVRRISFSAPKVPFASNLSGDWITAVQATDPEYWVGQLRHTVRFQEGIGMMLNGEPRVLLEVGPGHTLATLARMNQSGEGQAESFTSMREADSEGPDLAFQLGVLGRLWTRGVEVDWSAFYDGQRRRRVPLPTYPFERERYFITPGRGVPFQDGMDLGTASHASAGEDELSDWFYGRGWEEAPISDDKGLEELTGAVLVYRDDSGVWESVEEALRDAGADPVLIVLGREFSAIDEISGFNIRPGEPGDICSVLETLIADGRTPSGAVHLCLMDEADEAETEARTPTAHPDDAEGRAFFSLFALAHALGEVDIEPPFRLLVASTRMQMVDEDDPPEPWKSLAIGPVRVIPRELPAVRTRSVDFRQCDSNLRREVADRIVQELRHAGEERVVAYRGGTRVRETFQAVEPPPKTTQRAGSPGPVRTGGTYLITGGLGGLGLTFAQYLTDQASVNLVLLGRSELPPREDWDEWLSTHPEENRTSARLRAIRALEASGSRVTTYALDVSDEHALRGMVLEVSKWFGPVRGVIHAAGILDDAPILGKTANEAEAVLRPKVAGTLALERALDEQALDFFVVFSSRSAISGLPGQIDYTSANAFLDAWAQRSRAVGIEGVISVEWDVWKDVGMAADLHAGRGLDDASCEKAQTIETVDHCIFQRRIREAQDDVLYLVDFEHGTHWMLDEHRLRDGSPLIPGTGFLELVRSAFELEGFTLPLALRDVMFLAPFIVSEGEARSLGVRVRRDDRGGDFTVLGRPAGATSEADWTEHVRGRVDRLEAEPTPSVSLKKLFKQCRSDGIEVNGPPDNPFLDLGPRWSSLQRIDLGKSQAVLTIELPDAFADDLRSHPLHPALLDVATAGAQCLIQELRQDGSFFIPVSYSDIHVRAPLGSSLVSHVRLRERMADGMAVFDVSVMDPEGGELVAIEEFVMLRVDGMDQLHDDAASNDASSPHSNGARQSGVRSGGAVEIEGIEDGIGTEEGVLALERILRGGALFPPVVVTMRRDLFAVLAKLDAGIGTTADVDEEPPIDVQPLVDVLLEHPAIADGTAVAHRYGPGDERIVAFVVYDSSQPSTASEVRRFLRENLPETLVPQNFVEMTAIPRTAAGKIDQDALPDPFAPRDDYVAPRTPTEEAIAQIWIRLMGLTKVSIHENFLDAGGHSLLGIRALLQIEKRTGVRLHPNVLTMQTLEQLAAEVDRQVGEGHTTDKAAGPDGLPSRIHSAFRQFVGGS